MLMMSQTYIKLIHFNVNGGSRNMATTDVDRRFESVRPLPLGLIYGQEKDADPDQKQALAKLKADVKAEKISVKEAKARIAAIKRQIEYREVAEALEAEVKAGKISAKDAEAKLNALKKRKMAQDKRELELKQAAKMLREAVKANEISEQDAQVRMHELKLKYVSEMRATKLKMVGIGIFFLSVNQAKRQDKRSNKKHEYL